MTASLVAIMVAIWLVGWVAGVEPFDPRWAVSRRMEGALDLWRLLGHGFFHSDLHHLVLNTTALWLVGRPVERMIGSRGLLALFAMGVLAGGLVFMLFAPSIGGGVGASAGVFAVQGAALVALARRWRQLARATRVRLLFPLVGVPLLELVLWLIGDTAIDLGPFHLWFWVRFSVPPLITTLMHAAGLVVGLAAAFWLLDPRPWERSTRRPRATALACAATAALVVAIALLQRMPPLVTDQEAEACAAGQAQLCPDLVERSTVDCEAGDLGSCHRAGYFVQNGLGGQSPDPAASIALYQRACDHGVFASCANLAIVFMNGTVAADEVRARSLLQRACQGGEAQTCSLLGIFLLNGTGGAQDHPGARIAFEAGCRRDNLESCRALALTLAQGVGGERDPERALALLNRACDGGDQPSCQERERVRAEQDKASSSAQESR